jgi:hypothetical protein
MRAQEINMRESFGVDEDQRRTIMHWSSEWSISVTFSNNEWMPLSSSLHSLLVVLESGEAFKPRARASAASSSSTATAAVDVVRNVVTGL